MTRPDQTRPDQTTHVLKSFVRSLRSFLRRHDQSYVIRKSLRSVIAAFHKFYQPFDPWYNDKLHRNPSPTHKSKRIPYIIRTKTDRGGLFAYFFRMIGGIAYAEQKGYIPVIDMKNYPNSYLYDSEVGHVNAWEYYFTQPGGLTLEEALSCSEYIIGRDARLYPRISVPLAPIFHNDGGCLDHWRRICKEYIHFTQPVLDGVERELQKFAGKRVLGVSLRGTDYSGLKTSRHQVQPTIEQGLSKTREVWSTGDYDAVYLATEDKDIIDAFSEEFGENLILPDGDTIDYDASSGKWITELFDDKRENDKYLRGLEYLVAKLLLTKCKGLITSMAGGSTAAMCFSEGFDYLYVFDLGLYD